MADWFSNCHPFAKERCSRMKLPVQVVFHNVDKSEWIERLVHERAGKLESVCDHIISCRVVIEIPHKQHHQGYLYAVRIDISVPGKEIVVSRGSSEHRYEDIAAALKDSFEAAKRQLEDYTRKRRGFVKTHIDNPVATIARTFPEQGYGFIETSDGEEIYFHANSVLNEKFEDLKPGMQVAFAQEQGLKGPQASTVRILGEMRAEKAS